MKYFFIKSFLVQMNCNWKNIKIDFVWIFLTTFRSLSQKQLGKGGGGAISLVLCNYFVKDVKTKSTIQRCCIFNLIVHWLNPYVSTAFWWLDRKLCPAVACTIIIYDFCKTLEDAFFIDIKLQSKIEVILNHQN